LCSVSEPTEVGLLKSEYMCLEPRRLFVDLPAASGHPHLLGIGALSLAGISLPLVSLTLTSRGGGVLSLEVMRMLLNLSRFLLLSRGSMAAVSSSSCSSSSSPSTNSPSAVSWSGGEIHSLGTTHGNARPTLAARFNHAGPGLPVNLSHKYEEKWLQLLLSRLYLVP
jgi:hypothetical protein